jgi:hypothetical protein
LVSLIFLIKHKAYSSVPQPAVLRTDNKQSTFYFVILTFLLFSFIAKEEKENKHTCYVFVSDKLVSANILFVGMQRCQNSLQVNPARQVEKFGRW